MKKVLVIVGPTAVGKSDLAVKLAKKYNGEIISGDSIQVYKGFDIGSGKISLQEQAGVVHHMLDIKEPTDNYSVCEFQEKSRALIADISKRNKLPIIVGGTGLYIKACLYDYDFIFQPPVDLSKYDKLTNEELYAILQVQDHASSLKIHPNNRKRVLRALAYLEAGNPPKSQVIEQQKHEMLYDAYLLGCTMERSKLYARINQRVDEMFANGLLKEVSGLLKKCDFTDQAFQGIGYKEFKGYFNNEYDLERVKQLIKANSRKFAKRQYTWFNNQMPVMWFDMTDKQAGIFKAIEKWYNNGKIFR